MSTGIRQVVSIVCVAIAGMATADASAGAMRCGRLNIAFQFPNPEDAIQVCRGGDAALRFLAAQGLTMPPEINVDIVEEMPEGVAESALGIYVWKEQRVILPTYQTFQEREEQVQKLGVPISRAHYRAAASHEVAHAVAHVNFKAEPSLLAGEYIGYATLFYVLPNNEREKILERYPYQEGWEKEAAFIYMSDPIEFGAHAFRHFLKKNGGKAYLHKLLSGETSPLLPGE